VLNVFFIYKKGPIPSSGSALLVPYSSIPGKKEQEIEL
jgi:hypothetical protein